MVPCVDTKTLARERPPEQAPVRTAVAVRIRLDPRIAGSGEGRVARLERKRVDEEVQEDRVTRRAGRVRASVRGVAVLRDERSVDVVEEVRPDLADVVHLVERPDRRVTERVRRRRRRVRVCANTRRVINHPLTHGEVVRRRIGLMEPTVV